MSLDPEKIRLARETLTPAKRQNAIEYLDMLKDYTPQWMTERDHAFVTVLKEVVMYDES